MSKRSTARLGVMAYGGEYTFLHSFSLHDFRLGVALDGASRAIKRVMRSETIGL